MIQLVAERSKTSQFKNSNGIEFLDSISGYDLFVDHCLLNFFSLKLFTPDWNNICIVTMPGFLPNNLRSALRKGNDRSNNPLKNSTTKARPESKESGRFVYEQT